MIYASRLKCHWRLSGVSRAAQGSLAAIGDLTRALTKLSSSPLPAYLGFYLCFHIVLWTGHFKPCSSLLGFPFFVYLGGIRTLAPEKTLLRTEILEEDRARLGIRMLQHAASVLLPLVLSHHVSLMSGL